LEWHRAVVLNVFKPELLQNCCGARLEDRAKHGIGAWKTALGADADVWENRTRRLWSKWLERLLEIWPAMPNNGSCGALLSQTLAAHLKL